MKKKYVKPVMESEVFVANEYVATCYKIEGVEYLECQDEDFSSGSKCGFKMDISNGINENFIIKPAASGRPFSRVIYFTDSESTCKGMGPESEDCVNYFTNEKTGLAPFYGKWHSSSFEFGEVFELAGNAS